MTDSLEALILRLADSIGAAQVEERTHRARQRLAENHRQTTERLDGIQRKALEEMRTVGDRAHEQTIQILVEELGGQGDNDDD